MYVYVCVYVSFALENVKIFKLSNFNAADRVYDNILKRKLVSLFFCVYREISLPQLPTESASRGCSVLRQSSEVLRQFEYKSNEPTDRLTNPSHTHTHTNHCQMYMVTSRIINMSRVLAASVVAATTVYCSERESCRRRDGLLVG